MEKAHTSLSGRFYRKILQLLPSEFRDEFGGEMEFVFEEQHAEAARRNGPAALLVMWWHAILDLFRVAPREHLNVLSRDLRYALRVMRKNPGFTVATVLILALGIGANTAVFSLVYSVLLKPLPYREGGRIVVLRNTEKKLGIDDARFSAAEIHDYRKRTSSFEDLAEYHSMTFTLLGGAEARAVDTGVVSSRFFDLFGIRPLLGRTFTDADEKPGADAVLVLSYEYWKSKENGDPTVIGKTYRMNDRVHTVIGVLPPFPQYPDENDVYMPTSACPTRSSQRFIQNRDARMLRLFGRLRVGETLEHCRADLSAAQASLSKDFPASYPDTAGFQVEPSLLQGDLTARAKPTFLALQCATLFVLLIACANVANLMLTRMSHRRQEFMIRSALGAGQGRLLRQLLTESLLLTILGAGAGILLAEGSLRLFVDFAGQMTPRAREIALDGNVLAFTAACAALVTVVCGSVGALDSRQDLAAALKEGAQAATEHHSGRVRRGLLVAQVAFCYVLLVGAGLTLKSFARLAAVAPGFEAQEALAFRVEQNGARFTEREQRMQIYRRLLERLTATPGVIVAAMSSSYPLDPVNLKSAGSSDRFRILDDPRPEAEMPPVSFVRTATPAYFRALGIPLVSGRAFLSTDVEGAEPVVLINEALAKKCWRGQETLGRHISFDQGKTWLRIVGVVGDVKESGLGSETPYQVYLPLFQSSYAGTVILRFSGDLDAMASQVRLVIRDVEPEMAVASVQTMEKLRSDSIASPRNLSRLLAFFAGVAMLIAAGGVTSVLALRVRQRFGEIGIRAAIGASPEQIRSLFLRQGFTVVLAGSAIGLACSLVAVRFLSPLLFQVSPYDPATFVAVSTVLAGATLLASYPPAYRASRILPQDALRCN